MDTMEPSLPIARAAPDVQLKTEVVEYIENRISDVDSQFSSLKPLFDTKADCFVPQVTVGLVLLETEEVKSARQAFQESLKKWNQKLRDKGEVDSKLQVGSLDFHDWEDVIEALEDAQKRYQSVKGEGFRGRVQDCLRKCRDLKGPVESWLRLLPSESWQGSLFCGGLKVIVGIAAQIDETRQEISTVIEMIPVAIESAYKLAAVYTDDRLETYSVKLVVLVLEVMQRCLEWFMHKPVKKVLKAALRGKDYGRELSEKLKDLEACQALMDKCAMRALHERIGVQVKEDEKTRAQNEEIIKRMTHLEIAIEKAAAASAPAAESLNFMAALLKDNQKRDVERRRLGARLTQIQAAKEKLQAKHQRLAQKWKDGMMAILGWDPEHPTDDLLQCLSMGRTLSAKMQNRTAYILHSKEVENWIGQPTTQHLVINARETTADVLHSTASFFSALLIHTLHEKHPGVTLHWFCGRHHREDPAAMVANLLGQLLSQGLKNVDSDLLPVYGLPLDFDILMATFLTCLELQLQEGPVYCVLDSVSLYEDRKRCQDLVLLITGMVDVAGKFTLKVMATSPVQCRYLGSSKDAPDLSVLWVPRTVPHSWL